MNTTTARRQSAPPPPRPQLLTYPDSLGGDLSTLKFLLAGPLGELFQGVHILPPFPSTADRGFAPVTYAEIEPAFGTWADIEAIAQNHDVVLDVMINHVSRQSSEFREFQHRGRQSPHADLFITLDKVWPNGEPPASDLARIFLRKPDTPFSTITVETTGATEHVWTTFGNAEWSEQIDLDVNAPATRDLITDWLRLLAGHDVRIVRLDAVGYVTKRAGTSCFMVEPDIYDFLDWITGVADGLGLTLLPEVHAPYETHRHLSAHRYWTYDFVLPGLLLDALHTGNADQLARHLAESPAQQFTNLDCHDGIPVRPDLDGLLPTSALRGLAERTVARGGNVNRVLSPGMADELDIHQLNCTYYAAVGRDDDRYLAARAIQLFARGVPQIYYVGLLAGDNDVAALERVGDGRAINRHNYTMEQIRDALTHPVVKRLAELIRLRNTHRAFDGELRVERTSSSSLRLQWMHLDAECTLDVNLATGQIETHGRSP